MAPGKLSGGGAAPLSWRPGVFVADLHLEDPSRRGIGGMDDPSVYLSVCCRNSNFVPEADCPLYKVNIPDSLLPGASATRESPTQIAGLETDVEGMSFVSLPSGWIIGVGGNNPGGTIIIDTTGALKVIRGPNLLAAKWCPVLAAVGNKVYALCNCPNYKTAPNFVPWFEVLDLSKGIVVTDGTSLRLDGCFWEELPCPPFFPRKLAPTGYIHPPIISVRSYVVVPPYILLSLNQKRSCTYALDTNSGEWHKIDDKPLPFVGSATRHRGCVFLGSSLEDRSLNAYSICVSTSSSSSSTVTGVSGKGRFLKLSIAVCSIRDKEHGRVGTMTGQYIISLDRGRFSLLTSSFDNRKHHMISYCKDGPAYSKKLFAKLTTYHIENPALLEETQDHRKLQAVKHEIAVSKQREQDFEFFSSYGFSSPPIPFSLSI